MSPALRLLLPFLLLAATVDASAPPNFQYERLVSTSSTGDSCAMLPPEIFAHAAPALRDLRLFSTGRTLVAVPYVLTVSQPQQIDPDPARVINLHRTGDLLDFDLSMPPRPYTEVVLDLSAQNFLATADVTGLRSASDPHPTPLGQFTLFDLTAQHLSRNTTLALQEVDFPLLHIHLRFKPSRGQARLTPQLIRATVPPSREQQVLFETAMSAPPQQLGRNTVARFALPEHLPVERVSIRLAPGFTANFLRAVHIRAQPAGSDTAETTTGSIARIHRRAAGLELRQQQLSVGATIGANLQGPAELTVSVDNGADAPLPITSVELQVRQRKLCFPSRGNPLTLAYGDPDLHAPQLASSAPSPSASVHAATASIGPESLNRQWQARPEEPKERRRHPHLIWVVLLGLAALVGVVAARASRIVSHQP